MRLVPGMPARVVRRVRGAVHPDVQVTDPPAGIHVDWNVPVVLRDGVTLRVNVFRPQATVSDGVRAPVIMSAHPYNKDAMPTNTRSGRGPNPQYRAFPQPYPVRISAWTSWEAPDPGFWVPRGYAVVNVDLRGGGTSQGRDRLLSDEEALDYAEVIEWAGTREWSTGKVGLNGVSYLAISQYKVAALSPPHLAAICPWEGFSDLYRDFARPGGVLENGFSIVWSKGTARGARIDGDLRAELRRRKTRDGWFESVTPRLADITVPALVCGSFSDHNLHTRGSFEAFRRIGSANKWLYTHRDGKWCHFYGEDAKQVQALFFDWALKGADNGWAQRPAVRLAIHDVGAHPAEVRDEAEWPPADLTWTPLHLDAARGTLTDGDPPPEPASAYLRSRRDAVTFDWVVPRDLDLLGPMALRVWVETPDCADIHLFAGVRKLHAGREVTFEGSFGFSGDMVTHGWQRAAFRELDPQLKSRWQPVHTFAREQPPAPGEVVAIDVALLPQATRFRAGTVVRLELRGDWPYPRNPITGQFPSGYSPSSKGHLIVHSGGRYDSHLLVGARTAPGPRDRAG